MNSLDIKPELIKTTNLGLGGFFQQEQIKAKNVIKV